MILNGYFDKIFCHNLDRRPDRWERVNERFKLHGIEVERRSSTDAKDEEFLIDWRKLSKKQKMDLQRPSVYAIIKTYENTINHCIEKGYDKILMFEDDVTFHNELQYLAKEQLKNLPSDWDLWYLGGTRRNYDTIGEKFNNHFKIAYWVDGFFALAVNARVFKRMLDCWKQLKYPADSSILFGLQVNGKERCYCSTPRLCGHEYGYSDNFNVAINAEGLETNDLYYDTKIYR